MSNNLTVILAALITAAATIANGVIGSRLKGEKIKPRIWTPWRYRDKVADKVWWPLHIGIAAFLFAVVGYLFYPRWVILDSCAYHLGDNVFRMDMAERPNFSEPGGENIDHLILWDKDSGEYISYSTHIVYPDHEQWKSLHLDKYDEALGGAYYLGKCVIGYNNTFSLLDLRKNSKYILPPQKMLLDFDVFHLSHGETGGGIDIVVNKDTYRIRAKSKGQSNIYRWSDVEPISIPLFLLEPGLNTIFLFVTPKFTYHDGVKYFHFEDVEIKNLRVKLD